MGLFEDLNYGEDRRLGSMVLGIRECRNCSKEFRKTSPFQKYCCKGCRKKTERKKGKSGLLGLRFRILKRDNFTCKYCGKNPIEDDVKLQVDHIDPKSKGGLFNDDNLITSCIFCNVGKRDVLLDEHFKIKLKAKNKKTVPK